MRGREDHLLADGLERNCAHGRGITNCCDGDLLDLDADPFEQNDISGTHASEVAKLKAFVIAKDLTCTCYQCY